MRYVFTALTLTAVLALASGCDNFSVLGQFSRGGPLSLTVQKSTLQQGETVDLYPNGGTAPYTFGVIARGLYYPGTSIGSVTNESYTAGDAIGTVEILVTDDAGDSANTLVTIVPPTPGSFTAVANAATTANDIDLCWTYSNTSLISGFQIWRSIAGGTFSLLASVSNTTLTPPTFTYTDTGLNKNMLYTYRVYAIAGSYQSLPTPDRSAQP